MAFRKDIISAMQGVEREYRAASLGIGDLLLRCSTDPTILHAIRITNTDVRACRKNSESTYLVRMFAVFEDALRGMRQAAYGRTGPIKTFDLLQQCAARQRIPDEHRMQAHAVREYRNSIVHGGKIAAIGLSESCSRLCKFITWMPPKW